MSSEVLEQSIIKVSDQIAQMRSEAEKYKIEFDRISKEERLQQEQLQSSNANESHLIGREKTAEELELDKQITLSTLIEKVVDLYVIGTSDESVLTYRTLNIFSV